MYYTVCVFFYILYQNTSFHIAEVQSPDHPADVLGETQPLPLLSLNQGRRAAGGSVNVHRRFKKRYLAVEF